MGASDRSAQSFTIPSELLGIPAPIPAEYEIEDRVERIDLDLEIALPIANGIDKNLNYFLSVERGIAGSQRSPRLRVISLEEHAKI